MAIMNKNELFLTRVKSVKSNKLSDILDADKQMKNLESIKLTDIVWAEEYMFNQTSPLGTIILLNNGEFRSYIQSMEFIGNQVYRLVGRLVQEGKAVPDMPWMK